VREEKCEILKWQWGRILLGISKRGRERERVREREREREREKETVADGRSEGKAKETTKRRDFDISTAKR